MIYNVGGGGASSADKVSYDNTESGLQATNVQGAIDELNQSIPNLQWNYLGQIIGQTPISLPQNFNEILAFVKRPTTEDYIPINIPKSILTNTVKYFQSGGYANASANQYVNVGCSLTTISLASMFLNGANVTTSASLNVYYR